MSLGVECNAVRQAVSRLVRAAVDAAELIRAAARTGRLRREQDAVLANELEEAARAIPPEVLEGDGEES